MNLRVVGNTLSWLLIAFFLVLLLLLLNSENIAAKIVAENVDVANTNASQNAQQQQQNQKQQQLVKQNVAAPAVAAREAVTAAPADKQQQQKPKAKQQTPAHEITTQQVVVITDKPATKQHSNEKEQSATKIDKDDVTIIPREQFPDETYRAGFFFFVGISTAAILFIVFRVYRLRLSRAERKYGVHGDRANQELTPLPMAIEDFNSDEDDHTLFEINRKNLRIL